MATATALHIHVAPRVLIKLAMIASREVPGVEDIEGIYAKEDPQGLHPPSLYLYVTATGTAEPSTLADAVVQHVHQAVVRFTGIALPAVEVTLIDLP